jgi:hypothetical protein
MRCCTRVSATLTSLKNLQMVGWTPRSVSPFQPSMNLFASLLTRPLWNLERRYGTSPSTTELDCMMERVREEAEALVHTGRNTPRKRRPRLSPHSLT